MNLFLPRLRELLAESGKMQKDICDELGISKQKLSNWKTGYSEPNFTDSRTPAQSDRRQCSRSDCFPDESRQPAATFRRRQNYFLSRSPRRSGSYRLSRRGGQLTKGSFHHFFFGGNFQNATLFQKTFSHSTQDRTRQMVLYHSQKSLSTKKALPERSAFFAALVAHFFGCAFS